MSHDGFAAKNHLTYGDGSNIDRWIGSLDSQGQAWVWHMKGQRGSLLLYLHEPKMDMVDNDVRTHLFNSVSALAFVVPAGSIHPQADGRGDNETEGIRAVKSVIAVSRDILELRSGRAGRQLGIPTAIIVQDCRDVVKDASAEIRSMIEKSSVAWSLAELAKDTFVPVRYFGGSEEQGARAVKWLIAMGRQRR